MAIKGMWLAVDIIGTAYGKDVFIHSAGGERIATTLPRCAGQLGLGKKGEMVVEAVVRSLLAGKEVPKVDGLIVESHQIDASDGTPVALIVWIGEREPDPRPTYNVWVLDMSAMTTRTSGDDPSMIGDGREAGEERHVQYLFTWLNPEDVWNMVGGYYDALTGEDGMLIQSYWSLRPGGDEFVHMWSSCRLRLTGEGRQRTLYGLTLRLASRQLEANIANLVKYSNATLMLVEARNRIPLTTVGKHAPLAEAKVNQVLDQIDLELLASHGDPDVGAQKIVIDGEPYTARNFELHSERPKEKHGDPVAIILLLEDPVATA
ncbi:hypothetical protein [Rhodococcus qingshengii]|uniref:hypothetical protein n=1 Tax=Rhodococcus qingshengii TaxID=334542 RepID=UPI00301A66D9